MNNLPDRKIRVLSGIRASSNSLHLGNLLGAISGMVELQNDSKYETYYMVADLHGITTTYDPKELAVNRRAVVMDYIAAGIDPNKSVLFLQSDVSEHTEFAYYLSSVSSISDLMRMPSKKNEYKKYSDKGQLTGVTLALLGYPVLMAADILLYKAEQVPIGKDQEPHLEFAREVARRINREYHLDFPEPKRFSVLAENFTIPSLLGDGSKMSKSDPEGAIFLRDDLSAIKSKLAKVPTDSGKGEVIPNKGGVADLLTFVEMFEGPEKLKSYKDMYLSTGIRYGDLKEGLAIAIDKKITPIRERRIELESNPEYVDKVIKDGAEKARLIASKTLAEIKKKMGLA